MSVRFKSVSTVRLISVMVVLTMAFSLSGYTLWNSVFGDRKNHEISPEIRSSLGSLISSSLEEHRKNSGPQVDERTSSKPESEKSFPPSLKENLDPADIEEQILLIENDLRSSGLWSKSLAGQLEEKEEIFVAQQIKRINDLRAQKLELKLEQIDAETKSKD